MSAVCWKRRRRILATCEVKRTFLFLSFVRPAGKGKWGEKMSNISEGEEREEMKRGVKYSQFILNFVCLKREGKRKMLLTGTYGEECEAVKTERI